MNLDTLIAHLEIERKRHGGAVEVALFDDKGNDFDIDHVESFHLHGNVKAPIIVAVSACEPD